MLVDAASLRVGELLSEGGQGKVYRVDNSPGTAYKEYKNHARARLQERLLHELVQQNSELSLEGRPISYWAAWPEAVVVRSGSVIGFTMPLVPKSFFFDESGSRLRGKDRSLMYLAAKPKPIWGDVRLARLEDKLTILAQIAGIMQQLHHRQMFLGDLSWYNALWTVEGGPRAMIIDCDGIAVRGQTPTGEQLDSPDWDDPFAGPGDRPNVDRDCYKFGVLVYRVLAQSLTGRPTNAVEADALPIVDPIHSQRIATLLRQTAAPAGERPSAQAWRGVLQGRSSRSVKPPVHVAPRNPNATGASAPSVDQSLRRVRPVKTAPPVAAPPSVEPERVARKLRPVRRRSS